LPNFSDQPPSVMDSGIPALPDPTDTTAATGDTAATDTAAATEPEAPAIAQPDPVPHDIVPAKP